MPVTKYDFTDSIDMKMKGHVKHYKSGSQSPTHSKLGQEARSTILVRGQDSGCLQCHDCCGAVRARITGPLPLRRNGPLKVTNGGLHPTLWEPQQLLSFCTTSDFH